MDFVNWVISRVDEVMAQSEINRGGGDRNTQKPVPERFMPTEAVELPEAVEVPAPRSAA